jgi:hypothetical protein
MQRDDASVGRVTELAFCAASLRRRSNARFLSEPTSRTGTAVWCVMLSVVEASSSVEDLLEAAEARTGLSEWGDDWFRHPLAAWVEDLGSNHLNDVGRSFFTSLAVRDLCRRLEVIDTLNRHPEIDEVVIPPIVYLTGTVRSGTTLFHNVMSIHAGAKALLRWELMEPVPPPEQATALTDPRIARVQASIDKRRGTPLEAMHWVNADEPEECQWGFIDFVSLLAGAAGGCMLRWGEVSSHADYTRVFENYRRLIKLLLWKNPPPPGGFLVLKAPQVASHLKSFSAVFPEARFLATVRDPYRVFTSGRTMVGGIIDAFITDDFEPPDPFPIENLERVLQSLLDFNTARPELMTTVGYPALVSDPATVAAAAFAELKLPVDYEFASKVETFLDAQRSGARVSPPAVLPDHGLHHDQILQRPTVAAFCDRFGVEPERTRLTGAHP